MISLLLLFIAFVTAQDTNVKPTTTSSVTPTFEATQDGLCKLCYAVYDRVNRRYKRVCKTKDVCASDATCPKSLMVRCPSLKYDNTTCSRLSIAQRFPAPKQGRDLKGAIIYYGCQCLKCEPTIERNTTRICDTTATRRPICCKTRNTDKTTYRKYPFLFKLTDECNCKLNNGIPDRDLTNCVKQERNMTMSRNDTKIPFECPLIFSPVCTRDGKRFPNRCFALKEGVFAAKSLCKDDCDCKESDNSPVCAMINGELKTVRNFCRLRCLRRRLGTRKVILKGRGACKRDRICYVRSKREVKPVCDTKTDKSYASLAVCKCNGGCLTRRSYTLGRCRLTDICSCSDYKFDKGLVCYTNGNVSITLPACKARCARYITTNADTLVSRAVDSNATVKDGVCPNDKDDCEINNSVRKSCNETDDKPNKPNLRLRFKLKMCYADLIRRRVLFNALKEVLERLVYSQCNVTRDIDFDEIKITKFIPKSLIKRDIRKALKICQLLDEFDIEIRIFKSVLMRVRKAFDCAIKIPNLRQLIVRYLKQAINKRDPDATCKDTDQRDCSNNDTTIATGVGDIDIPADSASAFTLTTFDFNDDSVNSTDITATTTQDPRITSTFDNSSNSFSLIITFFSVIFAVYFL